MKKKNMIVNDEINAKASGGIHKHMHIQYLCQVDQIPGKGQVLQNKLQCAGQPCAALDCRLPLIG